MTAQFPDSILKRMQRSGSPYQLAALRIAFGFQIFYAVNSKIFDLLLAVGPSEPVSTIFPAWFDSLTEAWVPLLVTVCMVLSIALILGLCTRFILPPLTVAFIVLYGFYYRGANAPAQWLYLWFPLVVLWFTDSACVWSVDAWWSARRSKVDLGLRALSLKAWAVELMVGWFCYIYFAAGVAKLLPLVKGGGWMNGQTSKEIIYDRYLDSPFHYLFGAPFFNYAETSLPFVLLTIAAVLLELFTVVLLFTHRFHLLVLILVIAMHLFLFMTGVAGFTQTALVLGIALLPRNWFDSMGQWLKVRCIPRG